MSDTPPAPLTSAPHPSTPPPPGSWWGVALALAVVAAVTVGIVAVWWPIAPHPPEGTERYWPLTSGLTLSYRITDAAGSTSYQSENIERLEGTEASQALDGVTLLYLMAVGDEPLTDDELAQRLNALHIRLARVTDVTYDLSGAFTTTVNLMLVESEQLRAASLGGQVLNPPLPMLERDLAPGAARVISGTFGGSVAYTASLTLEATETLETPVGPLGDCQRMLLNFQLPDYEYTLTTRTWYCAGVGIARQESWEGDSSDITTFELIGLSRPGQAARGEAPPPLQPAVSASPRGLGHTGFVEEVLPETLETLWTYQDHGANNHVTAPPLPLDDLLLCGLQNGGLLALDRATHAVRWRFQTGDSIYGSPVVDGGRVYIGSNDRNLYAVDLASGAFRWAFATRDAISASPAVAEGLVYVGSEDRTLYALEAGTGHERWRYTTGGPIVTAPTIFEGVVYVTSDDGVLYALDALTGAARWTFATDSALTTAPTIGGGLVYVGSQDESLYALKLDTTRPTGEVAWEYAAEAALTSDLALSGDTLYAIVNGEDVRAVDRTTGRERWRYSSPDTLYGAPLQVGRQLLVNRQTDVLILDAATGAEAAQVPTGDPASYTGLSSDGQQVFVGRRGGVVQILGGTGDQPWVSVPRWQAVELTSELRNLADSLNTPPALHGDRLIFVTALGRIYAVDRAEGQVEFLGQPEGLAAALTPPTVAGDSLYVIDGNGVLLAFNLRTHQERWRAEAGGLSRSAPVVTEGRVLVAAEGQGAISVNAYAADSGTGLWQKTLPPQFDVGSESFLLNGLLFVAADAVYALDPATGDTIWRSAEPVAPFPMAADAEALYTFAVGAEAWALVAWEADTGRRRYQHDLALPGIPNFYGGLVAGEGRLILTLLDGSMLAFDAASGQELWRQPALDEPRGAPVVYGNAVLLTTKHNRLLARALDDGRLLGDFSLTLDTGLQEFSSMSPLILDGQLYAAFYQTPFALTLKAAP